MSDSGEKLREQIMRRLLGEPGKLPVSVLGRLGRTAVAAWRGSRLLGEKPRAGQDELDVEAAARLVSSIGQLKGVAMKFGQLMSYIDVALPETMRSALSVLQTHAQPMTFAQVQDIVTMSLGEPGRQLVRTMEEVPIAAASIGQVHRAKLPDGTAVAVKVQYPDVEHAIRSDFAAASIGPRIASIIYPGAQINGFVTEARARFLEECDYEHEAAAQARFARLFAGHASITVPEVHPAFCSGRVLTTSYVEGAPFESFVAADPPAAVRNRIGEALFEFYIGSLFRHGLYNCDPHPGNYLFLADGRVAVLDYGCTREFSPDFVARLARLTAAVHRDEPRALHSAFVDLGMVRDDHVYDFATARALVRSFYGPMLQDATITVDLQEAMGMRRILANKRQLLQLALPGEFLFLLRIRFGLMSVLARLGARANWYRLERGYAGL